METQIVVNKVEKYKRYDKTFKLSTLSLAIAFMYPNTTNILKRTVIITAIITLNGGQLFWFFAYCYKCIDKKDLANLSRNATLGLVLYLFFFKTYYAIYVTKKFSNVLNKISEDLLEANILHEKFHALYDDHIKKGKHAEFVWLITPSLLSAIFPVYSAVVMSFTSFRSDNFTRIMVHDMDLLFVEDIQSEGPFFHCMFFYNIVQCTVMLPNFCGFDSSFCIATIHLQLKLKLMIARAREAFENSQNCYELRREMRNTIMRHQNALEFYNDIHSLYGFWLFMVFLVTAVLISFNLYQIYLLQRIDPKYLVFFIASVRHMYLPCQYASVLFETGESITDELYHLPWEEWADPVVTDYIILMIARSQRPLVLTGSGMVVFNMELFKSILQTSYSFYTLITA